MCKQLSAEGSQVAAVEHETSSNHELHTYFVSVELDSVSGIRKETRKGGADERRCWHKEITNKPLPKVQSAVSFC